eukprot:COSAG05_NODE_3685_length_1907_cov_33.866704_1_plen_336_part_00
MDPTGPQSRRLRCICAGLAAIKLTSTVGGASSTSSSTNSSSSCGRGATVALISHEGGPHFSAYIDAAAALPPTVSQIVLCDMDGSWLSMARSVIGSRLTGVYSDLNEMLATENPLMSVVAMEAGRGPDAIRAVLEAGSHVMAEKPSCTDPADLRELTALADSKGLFIMMALSNRLNAETVKAKELIDAGVIGELYGMELHQVADQTRLGREDAASTWSNIKARAGGGHLIWLGIHWLDLAQYITGADIVQVAGFTANVGEHGKKLDVEDSAAASFKMSNGTLGTMTSAYFVDKGYNAHIKLWGSKGWIQVRARHLHNRTALPVPVEAIRPFTTTV